MRRKILSLVASFGLFAPMSATNMCVKQNDGTVVKYNIDDVEKVYYEDDEQIEVIPNAEDLCLWFDVNDDSTASVSGGCLDQTSIVIPSKVRVDGKVCTVTSISGKAFAFSDLTSIEISSSVTSIESYAFSGCSGLTSIEIPSSVTSIGSNAFSDCSGLTSIEIPSSVTSIGSNAFEGCTGLAPELLFYDNGTKCYGWIGDESKCVRIVIPDVVTSIGGGCI